LELEEDECPIPFGLELASAEEMSNLTFLLLFGRVCPFDEGKEA
jgi:hypothetical protein